MRSGYTTCGCPIDGSGAWHTPDCALLHRSPEEPKPPPIGPGSCVRLKQGYRNAVGLRPGTVYTVERVEDRAGQLFVFLVGDARPWKAERFEVEA
jgi:hypothetical protein